MVTVTHWRDGDTLNFPLIQKHTVSNDPDALPAYIRAASNGKLTLAGKIIEYTSGPRPYECIYRPEDPNQEWPPLPIRLADTEGKKAAEAHGINRDKFDYLISVIDCGGSGSAWQPGRFVGVYGQSGIAHIYKHEFGHSLGYGHGATYTQCPTPSGVVSAPGSCQKVDYGDTGDTLSGGGTLYPANFRWFSGWLDSSQATVIEKTGLYRLAKLGSEGPQLYLINRTGLDPTQLALEYRKPTPFDNFPYDDNRVNGVWIRYTTMGQVASNIQVDGTPQTPETTDPTFLPGKTLFDPVAKISVTVCSADMHGATMAVTVNGESRPSCTPTLTAPSVSTPRHNQRVGYRPIMTGTGMPGTTVKIERIRDGYLVGVVGSAIVGADGKWSAQIDQPLAAGLQQIATYSTNAGSPDSSNVSSAEFTVVDTPDGPTVNGSGADTTGPYPTFSGTGLPGAIVSVSKIYLGLNWGVVATALVNEEGKWSTQSQVEYAPGTYASGVFQKNGDKKSGSQIFGLFEVKATSQQASFDVSKQKNQAEKATSPQ
ncbi:transposase [Pseudomonas sp. C2B4]|uniref:transposase n=1 Tax=Pseudomonas sp. C2B4 TaxID=2735270 RepID=UPI001586F3E5|nr:transposase [Pseudomonas sp. C2B4]NUU35554.1 transposase [Pseudomonas sp. C2B4]